jgi:hypothetical protein
MAAMKPIKAFVGPRNSSVASQLAGKSQGESPRGPGGPGGPGPPMFLAGAFISAMDSNHDGVITRDEFVRGFRQWFETWSAPSGSPLSPQQLSAGINRSFAPPM